MNLNEAAQNAYTNAMQRERNGGAVKIGEILKHCAGEVIEAAEARDEWINNGGDRDSDAHDRYGEELADVIICALIAAYDSGVDIEGAVCRKMLINAQRAAMQGDKL